MNALSAPTGLFLVGHEMEEASVNKSDLIARMTERLSGDRTMAVAAVNGVLEEIKRSQLTEDGGVPLATVSAPANTRDDALLPATLDALKDFAPLPAEVTVHLDAGYDYRPCREALEERGLHGEIAHRGEPAPIQAGRRWVVERTNSWLNDFGKLLRCTERRRDCIDAYLALAAAIVTIRALLRAAWYRYRWNTRPRSPRVR